MEELHSWSLSGAASITVPKSFSPGNDISAVIALDRQTGTSLLHPSLCKQQSPMLYASRKI